jgi:hypothetical protein
MNIIEELKGRADLLRDPENIKSSSRKLIVFERIYGELCDSNSDISRQLEAADVRRYNAYSICASRN